MFRIGKAVVHAFQATACLLGLASVGHGSAADRIDFNRDVRPILGSYCVPCHGPDERERKAGLRLDLEADAKRVPADGAAVIVPGQPGRSELVRRILATDEDDRMPPPESKKQLSAAQREVLRRWIEQGAEYLDHWAFLPVADAEPPAGKESGRMRNGIDRFVFARLEREGVAPSPEALPGTLVRRIWLDLIGLLPSPEQVAEFERDFAGDADGAVERCVKRLLPTDAHGERWGRHWPDQARYADSHGYTIDGDRVMWPYRDWVIRAIRDDLPFDRFTVEQLAGDLLPHPTLAQQVATGFHRNTLINQEGGTDNEQFRNEEVVDRVNTTGAVWLGLTVGCAQCHSHKFDPVSQREYFRLFAFFNHTEDVNNQGPTVDVRAGELLATEPAPQLLAELRAAEAALSALEKSRKKRQFAWEQTRAAETRAETVADWTSVPPAAVRAEHGSKLKVLEDFSVLVAAGGAARENYIWEFAMDERAPIAALRLRVIPDASLPKGGPGLAGNGNFVLTRLEVFQGDRRISIVRAEADHAQPGYSVQNVIDDNPDTGWAINVGKETPKGVQMNAPHEAVFTFSEPVTAGDGPLRVVLRHEKNSHYKIGRFAFDTSPTPPAALVSEKLLAAFGAESAKRSEEQKRLVADEFELADTALKRGKAAVDSIRGRLGYGGAVKAMVMRETAKPRDTYVHVRGDFLRQDKTAGKLEAGVPAVFPALQVEGRPTRLDLARWLVRDDNPLTARVTVNRVWMRYFGRGLVETENDFGTQGTYPTHPELLDWLARRFMESGWSMHALHRLIVTSATYRQASHQRPELAATDPRNLLLARQNRLRFDAEIVRDAALSASGLLSRKVGGPSVRPPQPDGVYAFTQRNRAWAAAKDGDRFRRGLYTLFYRSAPYPMMTTFDSPDFQSVCTARPRSNTPLQSLTLANDEVFVELARGLAGRLLAEIPDRGTPADRERIGRAFMICYSRRASETEADTVAKHLERQSRIFEADEVSAERVAGLNSSARLAAWTAICRALINTDEFITRE